MQKKNGFTLLEVLIVVVIAVSVAAFSVPAYKKTQEKNKYLAAQGVLVDLGTAVRAVRADLASDTPGDKFPSGSSPVQVTTAWHSTAVPDNQITKTNAQYELFRREYMSPIPFDNGSTYKGYSFFVCSQTGGSSSGCCRGAEIPVACMKNDAMGSSSATKGQYWGAAFLEDGTVNRLTVTAI